MENAESDENLIRVKCRWMSKIPFKSSELGFEYGWTCLRRRSSHSEDPQRHSVCGSKRVPLGCALAPVWESYVVC